MNTVCPDLLIGKTLQEAENFCKINQINFKIYCINGQFAHNILFEPNRLILSVVDGKIDKAYIG